MRPKLDTEQIYWTRIPSQNKEGIIIPKATPEVLDDDLYVDCQEGEEGCEQYVVDVDEDGKPITPEAGQGASALSETTPRIVLE